MWNCVNKGTDIRMACELPSEDMGPRNMAGKAAAQNLHDGLQTAMSRPAIAENAEMPATR